jgi:hypothetical protein
VLSGEFNAMKNSVRCNGSLAEVSGEFNVEFIGFLSPLTARNATFVEEKSVKSPEIPPRSSGVGASRRVKRDKELHSLYWGTCHNVG